MEMGKEGRRVEWREGRRGRKGIGGMERKKGRSVKENVQSSMHIHTINNYSSSDVSRDLSEVSDCCDDVHQI